MSKSIRIKDYLYEQIERLASENRRPLISQLELLLEQALNAEAVLLDGGRDEGRESGTSQPSPLPPSESIGPYEKEFKPDFKGEPTKKKRR
jgi:hypothetical protein